MPVARCQRSDTLGNVAQQFCFQDEFALLVFLASLVGFVVLPSHSLLALSTGDVADDVLACCHGAFACLAGNIVHDVVEKIGFPMLTTEISTYDVLVICQMGLAVLATVNLVTVEIHVVCKTHVVCSSSS